MDHKKPKKPSISANSAALKNYPLLPGEKIVNVINGESRAKPDTSPSAIHELYSLAGVPPTTDHTNASFTRPVYAATTATNPGGASDPGYLKLYEALFGRDSLRVAQDTLGQFPELTRVTLVELAKLQGREFHTYREEEPGRIIHENRHPDSPLARELTEKHDWGWPYYASVDATPTFVSTIVKYVRQSPEGAAFFDQPFIDTRGDVLTMRDSFEQAVTWIILRIHSNPEGLIEHKPAFKGSIPNQVWKDSPDSYFHEDGTLANRTQGISSIEVQALAYDALLDAAEVFRDYFDDEAFAEDLTEYAHRLGDTILRRFWTKDKGGYFVLGLDRDDTGKLRRLKVRTSNMGHLLYSRLLMRQDEETKFKRDCVIMQLFSPGMLNVSGIRTLASDEIRFRPGAYHNGSVWLWDTHIIILGLLQHGYYGLARNLIDRIHNVISTTHMFPEYAYGDDGPVPKLSTQIVDIYDPQLDDINRIEQPPQEIQAWSVGAILSIEKILQNLPDHALDEYKHAEESQILDELKV